MVFAYIHEYVTKRYISLNFMKNAYFQCNFLIKDQIITNHYTFNRKKSERRQNLSPGGPTIISVPNEPHETVNFAAIAPLSLSLAAPEKKVKFTASALFQQHRTTQRTLNSERAIANGQ